MRFEEIDFNYFTPTFIVLGIAVAVDVYQSVTGQSVLNLLIEVMQG